MKDPSIHIKKSDLSRVLNTLGYDINIDLFMRECSKYSCNHRSYFVTTKAIKKKLSRSENATDSHVNTFRTILIFTRQARGHKQFSEYKAGVYLQQLREVVNVAVKYCDDFELSYTAGFKKFCSFMVDKMGNKFRLNKMKFLAEDLYNKEQRLGLINEIGEDLVDNALVSYEEQTGIELKDKETSKEVFAEVLTELSEFKVPFDDYLAQTIEDYKITGRMPTPQNLLGEKLEPRILRMGVKNKTQDSSVSKTPDWYEQLKNKLSDS